MSIDEFVGVVRQAIGYMTPTVADTATVRVGKYAFRLSALVLVASVATVALASPEPQLAVS
jgi:hypothetical protein